MYMTNHGWVPEYHKIVKTNADRIRAMTDEEMERQARHNTLRMGGVIN